MSMKLFPNVYEQHKIRKLFFINKESKSGIQRLTGRDRATITKIVDGYTLEKVLEDEAKEQALIKKEIKDTEEMLKAKPVFYKDYLKKASARSSGWLSAYYKKNIRGNPMP